MSERPPSCARLRRNANREGNAISGEDEKRPEANQEPRLRLALLGEVRLAWAGRPVPLASRKARLILAYLALHLPRSERRERLAGLFWSEFANAKALTSLRQAVHEMREVFARAGCTALLPTHDSLALRDGCFSVDTEELLAALHRHEVPEPLLQPRLHESLLAGCEDLDPALEDWVAAQRQAFQSRLVHALEAGLRDEDLPSATRRRLAEAALRLEPLHEEACRVAMLCAAEQGETAAAVRFYDELYRALGEEHDMEPGALTQQLIADIKLGRYDPTPVASAAPPPAAAAEGVPRLAVLPFRWIGTPAPQPWLAEGLVTDIVCMLSGLREPVVISSNSTRNFRPGDADIGRAARELNVRYAVAGTLRLAGEQLRLSVELVEAASGAVVWAHNFDAGTDLLFDVQDRIVAQIAHSLSPRVHRAELNRVQSRRPEHLGAYHLMLRARELIFALEPEPFEQAGALLHQAIALDPNYAASHTVLAEWCSLRLGQGWSSDRAADQRLLDQSARTAVRHDPDNARALALLGHYRTLLHRDYQHALEFIEHAEQAAPNDAAVLTMSSPTFAFLGDGAEAIRRAERALQLSPHDPFAFRIHHFLSVGHYNAGNAEAAEHWGRSAYQENPNYTSNLRLLACVLAEQDKLEEARGFAARAMQLEPRFRVRTAVANHASRNVAHRVRYGEMLLKAGMPA